MNAMSINNLWHYMQGLPLTASNQRWLANHLISAAENTESMNRSTVSSGQKAEIEFPKIPKDYKPSPRIMAMTLGPLPDGVDLEKELDNRWEEWER